MYWLKEFMNDFSKHLTRDGRKLSVYQMSTTHILNCINLWQKKLNDNSYRKPGFVQSKIRLYKHVLNKRRISHQDC